MRFPEFTGEWKEHSLSEYLEFKNGLNPDAKRIGKGIPFLSVMDILADGVINYDNIRGKVEATEKEIESFGVNSGDLLFQRSSETLEDVGRANVYMDNRTAVYGGFVIRGRKIGSYDPFFVKYLLATPLARKRTCRMGAGAQHFNIGQESLAKISLYFPSMEEQQKIAEFLSLLDERIATQNKIIKKLETLIKAIGNKLLFGDEQNIRLGNILIERVEKSTTNNQYEVLSSTVKGIFSQRDYFSKDIASENNTGYKILRRGDIVLSPQNLWMGNINHNDKFDIGIVSPSYKIFTISEEFDCHYIAFLLKTRKALYGYMSVSEQGASVVRRNLNLEAFYELTYKIPHIAEQRRIGQILSKLKDKIESEQTYLEMLRAQKQYLLSNLFI
ncbi:restriction endonuclease subunit S [uncultured Alistipes sp.]|uniref:restriction endonuclease subunit S n=1 Tax=uncultured Alistipes sp. TaxID=538949 RepID=UPI00259BCD64|nr:restriction endonuclease subunit S [uncultured Alistipes sp.]